MDWSDPLAGFDCSGLVAWAWSRVGVLLPHSTREIRALLETGDLEVIADDDWAPADLLFFDLRPRGHVALYSGGGMVVHAHKEGILEEPIREHRFWRRYACAGRARAEAPWDQHSA